MKKIRKIAFTLVLTGTVLFSSCLGSFSLTNKVLDWNRSVGDQWVNELVFLVCYVVPVYEISVFLDAVILNSMEFWTGSNPMAVGETKTVKSENGEFLVKTTENGYNVTNGEESVDFVYNKANNSWNVASDGKTTELMHINADGTATLCNGKTVTIDAAGLMAARQSINNSFLASR
jgi:hypothetical protein